MRGLTCSDEPTGTRLIWSFSARSSSFFSCQPSSGQSEKKKKHLQDIEKRCIYPLMKVHPFSFFYKPSESLNEVQKLFFYRLNLLSYIYTLCWEDACKNTWHIDSIKTQLLLLLGKQQKCIVTSKSEPNKELCDMIWNVLMFKVNIIAVFLQVIYFQIQCIFYTILTFTFNLKMTAFNMI